MSKNAKTSKKNTDKVAKKAAAPKTPKASAEKRPIGRPRYSPTFPTAEKWTLRDFMVANGVDPKTGKGENCSKLTLIKFLTRDLKRKGHSTVKRLDETVAPISEKGLGRKAFVYTLRNQQVATDASATVPADTSAQSPDVSETVAETPTGDVTVTVAEITPDPIPSPETPAPSDVSPETADYEAKKAALLG